MTRRAAVLVSVLLLVAGGALAACGDSDGGVSGGGGGEGGGSSVRDVPLEGTEWVLDQQATELETVAPEVTVTARFDGGRVGGSSGCNRYTGSYTLDGARLTIGPLGSTLMACPPPASNVEMAYLELLPTARAFSIAGSRLTVATTTRGAALVYYALDPAKAVQGKWTVLNYFRPGAVTSPVARTTLTAEFADGTVAGDSGCNRYTGPYELDGTAIRIGPLASTLRACADPAVDQQEREFLAALELARSVMLDRGNLVLLRADGGIAVTLAPA